MPLPAQQVQAATVAALHAEGPIGTQHLAWRAVAAWLAVPLAVLGGGEAARKGSGEQKTGPRGQGGVPWGVSAEPHGNDEVKEEVAHSHSVQIQYLLVPSRGEEWGEKTRA